jgi:hypothetical protein
MRKCFAIFQVYGESVRIFFENDYFDTEEAAEEFLAKNLDRESEHYTFVILKIYMQLTPLFDK